MLPVSYADWYLFACDGNIMPLYSIKVLQGYDIGFVDTNKLIWGENIECNF